jgi:hypothetical protein
MEWGSVRVSGTYQYNITWADSFAHDKHLHNIQAGDLVKIRSEISGRLAIVLAIEQALLGTAHHMRTVEVLLGEQHWNFMAYELEKIS